MPFTGNSVEGRSQDPLIPLFLGGSAAHGKSGDGPSTFNVILLEDPKLLAARSPNDESDEHWGWLAGPFPDTRVKAQVLRYNYSLPGQSHTTSVWQGLIQSGSDLLQELQFQRERYKLSRQLLTKPLIFVAHGLGGVVLKKTLCNLYEQDDNPFNRSVLHVLAGTFFLGTPHPTYYRQHSWPQHLNLILQSSLKLSKRRLIQTELQTDLIFSLSFNFQKAGIDIPVFSIYETKTTKVQTGLFQSRKIVLVDSATAVTNLKAERLIAVDQDHYILHKTAPGSQLHEDYRNFVKSVQNRPSLMLLPIRQGKSEGQSSAAGDSEVEGMAMKAPWASTISEYDIPDSDQQGMASPIQSQDATAGSTEIAGQYQILPTLTNFLEPKRSPKIPCYVLRPHTRNLKFFGRQDILSQIQDVLASPADATSTDKPRLRTFALCGLGGVGKTQTAAEFVFSHQQTYDAIFWVQADDAEKLAVGFSQIATELGIIDPADIGNLVVSRDLALGWLLDPYKTMKDVEESPDAAARAKWLLVFDNADDPELLRDYWPAAGEGSILITSRDPLAKSHFQSSTGVDLKSFNLEEATSFILKLTDQESTKREQEPATELARRVDGLPLAITQLVAYLRRQHLTLKEVLDIFEKRSPFVELQKLDDYYSHTIFTVWSLEALSPAAMELLQVLSYLDPDAISESILNQEDLPDHIKGQFLASDTAYIDARLDLLRSSLVVRNQELGQITLHRLVQDVVRTRMTLEKAKEIFKLTIALVSHACPRMGHMYEPAEWNLWDPVQPHLLRIQTFYQSSTDLGRDIDSQKSYAALLVRYAWYQKEHANFDITQSVMTIALPICEKYGEEMPELLADAYFCLVSMTAEINQPQKCLEYGDKHLNQRLKLPDAWSHAMGYSERAMSRFSNRQFQEALDDCLMSRSITSLYFSVIHTAISLAGLKRYDDAATELTNLLEHPEIGDEEMVKADTFFGSFRHGHALHNLAIIRRRQGRHGEAFELFKQAFVIYQSTLGMNHHYTGDILAMLGSYHFSNGEVQTASTLLDQAISIFDRGSWYKPELARSTFLRAGIYVRLGDTSGYETSLARARQLLEDINGATFAAGEKLTLEHFDSVVPPSAA